MITKFSKMKWPALSALCASALIIPAIGFRLPAALAQTMSSADYRIQSDSLNFGGSRSSSASYVEEDTAGEAATGISSSAHYIMGAGYQEMQVVYLSVTSAASVVMSPSLGGITGGTSNGSTSFIVTTDDPAGYAATIQASTSPALSSGPDSFADYVPAGSVPDFTFSNGAASSSFAFSPKSADNAPAYMDNGTSCGAGSSNTAGACWDGLSTSPKTILYRTSDNTPAGTAVTLNFRAASGSGHVQANGTYTATTTVTVMAL